MISVKQLARVHKHIKLLTQIIETIHRTVTSATVLCVS